MMKPVAILYKICVLFLLTILFIHTAHSRTSQGLNDTVCETSPMLAKWKVKDVYYGKHGGKNTASEFTVTMWRQHEQVALHYSNTGITELWHRQKNKQLKLVKYFEVNERGIEYMPNEIKGRKVWLDKWQLVSEDYIKVLSKKSEKYSGCEVKEEYLLKNKKEKIKLSWLPKQKIATHYQLKTKARKLQWKLLESELSPEEVALKFKALSNYQTTDYTDVGDNESDPFLAKMIYMGFVEHASSGFYNASGEEISAHH